MSKPANLAGFSCKTERDVEIKRLWDMGYSASAIVAKIGKGLTTSIVYGLANYQDWPKKNAVDAAKVRSPHTVSKPRAERKTRPDYEAAVRPSASLPPSELEKPSLARLMAGR